MGVNRLTIRKSSSDAPQESAGLVESQRQDRREIDDPERAQDDNGHQNGRMAAEEMTDCQSSGRCHKGSSPKPNQRTQGNTRVADAAVQRSPEQRKFNPGCYSSGNGEPGRSPVRLDAQQMRQRKRTKNTEDGRQDNSNYGEAQRSARIP